MIEDQPRKQEERGGAWITTFADLMSLLMCFFVLLLSFAELDIMKFKAVAGSMKLAFGVQREIKAIEVPKGTSIIAQEFSPGTPDPGVINEIRQQTTDEDKQTLEFTDALVNETDGEDPEDTDGGQAEQFEETEADAQRLVEALKNEIEEGMIQIETQADSIVIRIREKGSFPSGTALFDPAFQQVLDKLRDAMQDVEGTIAVAGHTDDIPISTSLYRSNWDLSSARAVSVVHALLESGTLDVARFVVEGHGDAHPLVPNDTAENRTQNRRVEVTIRQSQFDLASVQEAMAAYSAVASGDVPVSPPQEPESVLDEPAESTAREPAIDRPKSRMDLIREGIGGA
ncbi:MAG: flagellar motor protein MotB [Proteobacteria bacterium]|nr:flagellar motor protein MotB [Pseudomonadota bacterium]